MRGEGAPTQSIANLVEQIAALPSDERSRAERLLHVSEEAGGLKAPTTMHDWIVSHFGSVAAVEQQYIVRTTNLVTFEGAVFNTLRAQRPFDHAATDADSVLEATIRQVEGDPFCYPLEGTPEDVFGRLRGEAGMTASNIAKYAAFHAVIIFKEHHPLRFDRASIADAIDLGCRWGQQVIRVDPEAKYWFWMWNCLWKAGASIVHGHAQVSSVKGMHYPKIEALRRQAEAYRVAHQVSYFDDLVGLHRALGLVVDVGDTAIVSSLTPVKEKEVLLVAPSLTDDLVGAIGRVLDCFVGQLGVISFNVGLYTAPLGPTREDWAGFPCLVRIVDRGPLTTRTTDVGAMELYAASVVSSDPFRIADALRESTD
jgi:hypothetical protein